MRQSSRTQHRFHALLSRRVFLPTCLAVIAARHRRAVVCRSGDFVLLFCLARRSRFVLLRRQGGGHVCKGYPLGLGLLFDLNPGNLASGRLARMGLHLQAGALAIVRASGLVSVMIRLVCSCLAASGSSSRLFRVTLAESVALGK